MFRAVYVVLRDCGRRPTEVSSLPRNCLEREGDGTLGRDRPQLSESPTSVTPDGRALGASAADRALRRPPGLLADQHCGERGLGRDGGAHPG